VGARRPHKNLARLVSAFASLAGEHAVSLVLVGTVDRRFHDDARDGIDRLRAAGKVVEVEHVEEADLPAVYSMAELFVQPSVIEGFGLPLLEAMACGCPAVCSRSSSLPEVAGDAALLFDPLSDEEMASAMRRALAPGPVREQLRERGPRRARLFTWSSVADRTLSVYREAAGRVAEEVSA
jgi:glycosyltransferase involved in cell wall biosynthesis